MMKKNCKHLFWLSMPILLVVGCAENQRPSSVSYSPALSESVAPTSDRSVARVYPETPTGAETSTPPAGAASQDWALAEEIRSLLMSDPKLGNAPMAAVVNNGVVTLRGSVRNAKDREKLREEIARLPGVQRVDDQMEFKNPLGTTPGETKNY
jgi:osmotically-inducible protein OsmY